MRKLATGFATTLTAAVAILSMTGGTATAATTWTINPTCATVTGPAALTYTTDEGTTLKATSTAPTPITYTSGLAALDSANTLIAVQEVTVQSPWSLTKKVYRSTNAGCTWTAIHTLADGWMHKATAAKGGRAYLWSQGNDDSVYRVSGTTVTKVVDPTASTPVNGQIGLIGLGVDPANGLHVYAARKDGQLFESTNGGNSWTPRGSAIALSLNESVNEVEFDVKNPLHAVAGVSREGVWNTFDGGVTWNHVQTLDATTHPNSFYGVNINRIAVSPLDPNVVYAQGFDLSQVDSDGDQGRQIWRSTDGGRNFTAIVHHDPATGVFLTNDVPMYPSPTDANVLYFVYADNYANYGTDLFRYHAGTGALTHTHNQYHRLDEIVFNPKYPTTMYLALGLEP
ncbi:hypothetical protein AB0M43_10560 [Longispora sp. NPDC051575]|uniref:WD40/YVTN/BNR-like repeat-containing protein n=1 Tax=Longispora sp. NPDC051575 TaxID=3154943 RepID=UPI00344A3FB2